MISLVLIVNIILFLIYLIVLVVIAREKRPQKKSIISICNLEYKTEERKFNHTPKPRPALIRCGKTHQTLWGKGLLLLTCLQGSTT
jgi:hypothetical protein